MYVEGSSEILESRIATLSPLKNARRWQSSHKRTISCEKRRDISPESARNVKPLRLRPIVKDLSYYGLRKTKEEAKSDQDIPITLPSLKISKKMMWQHYPNRLLSDAQNQTLGEPAITEEITSSYERKLNISHRLAGISPLRGLRMNRHEASERLQTDPYFLHSNSIADKQRTPRVVNLKFSPDTSYISDGRLSTEPEYVVTTPKLQKNVFHCKNCLKEGADTITLFICSHRFCESCLKQNIKARIMSKTLPLECPRIGCRKELHMKDLERLVEGYDMKIFKKLCVEKRIFPNGGRFFYCPTLSCKQVFDSIESEDSIERRCPKCYINVCITCKSKAHPGLSCYRHRQAVERAFLSGNGLNLY